MRTAGVLWPVAVELLATKSEDGALGFLLAVPAGSVPPLAPLALSISCLPLFLQANDAYLQMAIGNAPWPIGVTMVGIHARTGREKIFSKHVAHVLNDETQRKYIQVR